MGFVLRADGSTGSDAGLTKTQTIAHLYATIDVYIPAATLALFNAASSGFIQLETAGATDYFIAFTQTLGPPFHWSTLLTPTENTAAVVTTDAWHTISVEYTSAGNLVTWSADGSLVYQYALDGTDSATLKMGAINPGGIDGEIYYFDNARISAISDTGSEIVLDTFESGAISASWTSSTGDVSVIADPTVTPDRVVISGLNDISRDLDIIINSAQATPDGILDADIAGQTVSDATSIAINGVSTQTFPGLITDSGILTGNTDLEETLAFATYYVNNYKDPRTRVGQVVLRTQPPGSAYGPAWWAFVCGVELGDLVTLTTTFAHGGGFDESFYVEGIHYEASPMTPDYPDVTVTLDLSPQAYYLDGTGVTG